MHSFRFVSVICFLGCATIVAAQTSQASQVASVALQLASVSQQSASVEVQRQSATRQVLAAHRLSKSAAFIEPLQPVAQLMSPVFDCLPLAPIETERLVSEAAHAQSLPPALLRAVIRQESAFRPCAVSIKGAQGLMQLMPETAAALNVSDPFDPHQNVLGGAAYLRQLMERYNGDASLALSAYNAGPLRVDRDAAIPNIPETQNYVATILRDLEPSSKASDVALVEPDGQTEEVPAKDKDRWQKP